MISSQNLPFFGVGGKGRWTLSLLACKVLHFYATLRTDHDKDIDSINYAAPSDALQNSIKTMDNTTKKWKVLKQL